MKIVTSLKLMLSAGLIFCFVSFALAGTKVKVESGDLSFLKGQKKVLVAYDYSNMAVGKYKKEEDYVNKKVADYNKDEPGRGDKWKASWEGDRKSRFEPQFEELLNKELNGHVNVSQQNNDAQYKMIVHTTFTEPGFNIAITKKPASINLDVTFVEASSGKTVAKMVVLNAPGRTFGYGDFDTGVRIAEAYAKAGKELGAFIAKTAFK